MAIDPQINSPHRGRPMSEAEYLELDRNATNARYEYIDGVASNRTDLDAQHLWPWVTGAHPFPGYRACHGRDL